MLFAPAAVVENPLLVHYAHPELETTRTLAADSRIMNFVLQLWQLYLAILAGWINEQQREIITSGNACREYQRWDSNPHVLADTGF